MPPKRKPIAKPPKRVVPKVASIQPTPERIPFRKTSLASDPYGIDSDELQAARKVLDSGHYTQGPQVAKMESQFLNHLRAPEQRSALMVNSGSSANLLAAALLRQSCDEEKNLRREVLTPALTWPTTVYPLIQMGFTPVFVDVGPDYCMDAKLAERAITDRTVAIAPVHLLGHACDMTILNRAAYRIGLKVLEDCCEALGTEWEGKPVGTTGFTGSFSFYHSHHISTMEGGMFVYPSNHHEATALREHGWIRNYPESIKQAFRSNHPELDDRWVFDQLGYNVRSTDVAAAIGLVQLGRHQEFRKARKDTAKWYDEHLIHESLNPRTVSPKCDDNPFSYPILIKKEAPFTRAELAARLEAAGIETRPIMSGDITQHPWFQRNTHAWRLAHPLDRTKAIHHQGLLVPCRPGLTRVDLDHVLDTLHRFLKEKTGKGLA